MHLEGDIRLTAAAADSHAEAGITVVLEDVARRRHSGAQDDDPSRPCHVVVLAPAAAGGFGGDTPRLGIWIETSELTPAETVDLILEKTSATPMPIVIVDYDPAWPALFARSPIRARSDGKARRQRRARGQQAVPGLAAKPVIEIDVVVGSTAEVPPAIDRLRRPGYVYQGDKGIPGREAFLWPPGSPPHHLYVVVCGSAPHTNHIRFRDHLRAHPTLHAATPS